MVNAYEATEMNTPPRPLPQCTSPLREAPARTRARAPNALDRTGQRHHHHFWRTLPDYKYADYVIFGDIRARYVSQSSLMQI